MEGALPQALRKEIAALARKLAKEYRTVFAEDPALRKRAGQFLTALLPPKPRRRGRPGDQTVTKAIRLLRRFRRQYPNERGEKIWERIYPEAIPNYASMSEVEQADARQQLRERVRWRLKASRRTELSKQGHPAALVNGN
jgi:hypothetical protein